MKKLCYELRKILSENGIDDAIVEYKENWYICVNDAESIYMYIVEDNNTFNVLTNNKEYKNLSCKEVVQLLKDLI